MIDAAALLVIGREPASRSSGSAPTSRRGVSSRSARSWVDQPPPPSGSTWSLERTRSETDQRWLEEEGRRIALAEENLEIRTREISTQAPG